MPRIAQSGLTRDRAKLYGDPQPRSGPVLATPHPPAPVSPSPLLLCPTPSPMASPESALAQFYSRSTLPKQRVMPVVTG